jgi:hypothetical protein
VPSQIEQTTFAQKLEDGIAEVEEQMAHTLRTRKIPAEVLRFFKVQNESTAVLRCSARCLAFLQPLLPTTPIELSHTATVPIGQPYNPETNNTGSKPLSTL